MLLVLRILSYRNAPASLQGPAQFSMAGGTIGRSPGNDLVLDDPGKYISRTHARILFRDGRFYLADQGSNPSVVNDRPLGNGREVALVAGDQIVIGEYELEVQVTGPVADATVAVGADPLGLGAPAVPAPWPAPAPSAPVPELPMFEPPPPRQPVVLPPLETFGASRQAAFLQDSLPPSDLHDPLVGAHILGNGGPGSHVGNQADPLGLNLFGAASDAGAVGSDVSADDPLGLAFRGSVSDHAAPERQALPVPAPAWPAGGIPEDYDPMADFQPKAPAWPAALPAAAIAASAAPTALQPTNLPSPLDVDFPAPPAPSSPAQGDAPTHFNAASDQQRAQPSPGPPALSPVTTPAPQPPARLAVASAAQPESLDVIKPSPRHGQPDAFPLPETAAASPPAFAASSAPATASGQDATLEALLRGLGLPHLQTKHTGPELAELVGVMLREATGGVMHTLRARAVTKRESRIEMTMIASKANNPLKFFPDPASALNQMLSQASGGYMPAARAFGNAFEDLQAHELAVMAGMRAALAAILARFDPAAIEKRLDVPTVMDKMMASSRKAKMWDRLVLLYADISREADDDFQRLFGESFAKAYEDQINRLHGRAK